MLGAPMKCVLNQDSAAYFNTVTKHYSPSLHHFQRSRRLALGYLRENFFGEEQFEHKRRDGKSPPDGKLTLETAATSDYKVDVFTKALRTTHLNNELALTRVECKVVKKTAVAEYRVSTARGSFAPRHVAKVDTSVVIPRRLGNGMAASAPLTKAALKAAPTPAPSAKAPLNRIEPQYDYDPWELAASEHDHDPR